MGILGEDGRVGAEVCNGVGERMEFKIHGLLILFVG